MNQSGSVMNPIVTVSPCGFISGAPPYRSP